MSTIDGYLGNVRVGGRAAVNVPGAIGVLVFVALACVLVQPGNGDAVNVAARLLGVGWLSIVLIGGAAVLRTRDALDEASQLLAREELPDAIAASQRAISGARDATAKARGLLVLGRCAELAGDFGEAAQIFGHGLDVLRTRRSGVRFDDVADELAQRRAFCVAVAARGDTVATAPLSPRADRRLAIEVLWLRAEAIGLVRRGDRAGVLAALREHGKSRASAIYRDRTLLSAASVWASCTDDTAPAARVRTDERTWMWIERVSPALAACVGVVDA